MNLPIKKLHPEAILPTYGTNLSAGFDLYALNDTVIIPGGVSVIQTGLAVQIPVGYEIQIRPRSGLSLKTKLRLPNSPGTIDADYRNDVGVILENTNPASPYLVDFFFDIQGKKTTIDGFDSVPMGTYLIRKGERIAQGVLAEFKRASFMEVDELDETERKGGFGSTGTK